MRTKTKIILGLVLFFPVLFGGALGIGILWEFVDPVGYEKTGDDWSAYRESEEQKQAEEEAQKQAEEEKQIHDQKMKNSLASAEERRYESMVLNYKGIDGKGYSIKDFADARCRDNQESFADYTGDIFDDKSGYYEVRIFSPINTNLNPPCLGATWYFGVNNQGDVIAWDWSSERQDILDYLDEQG